MWSARGSGGAVGALAQDLAADAVGIAGMDDVFRSRGDEDVAFGEQRVLQVHVFGAGEAGEEAGFLAMLLQGGDVQAVRIVDGAVVFDDADNLESHGAHQPGGKSGVALGDGVEHHGIGSIVVNRAVQVAERSALRIAEAVENGAGGAHGGGTAGQSAAIEREQLEVVAQGTVGVIVGEDPALELGADEARAAAFLVGNSGRSPGQSTSRAPTCSKAPATSAASMAVPGVTRRAISRRTSFLASLGSSTWSQLATRNGAATKSWGGRPRVFVPGHKKSALTPLFR